MHTVHIMWVIFILSLVILLTLLIIPEKIWAGIIDHLEVIVMKIKRVIELLMLHWQAERATPLVEALIELEGKITVGRKTEMITVPKYKFYTALIHLLLGQAREYGMAIKKVLRDLRYGIIKDDQFERKLQKEKWSGLGQFISTALITWFFIFFTNVMIDIQCPLLIMIIIIVLQIGGGWIYLLFFNRWRGGAFFLSGKYLKSLYLLQSLAEVGLSTKEVLRLAQIGDLLLQKNRFYQHVNSRVERLLTEWQKQGVPIKQEIIELLEEVWFLQEQKYTAFLRRLLILKFMIMAIFFLSAYFIYLLFIFVSFLSQ